MNSPADIELDEGKLGILLMKKKLLTEGQLKAALDYQRSLGGKLADIVVRLDMARAAQLAELLERSDEFDGVASRALKDALDPTTVKVSELKVHRRLLEKVPQDLVESLLLVLFFPSPSGDSRKIILGHGSKIGADDTEKVRSHVGAELATLALDPEVAKGIISEYYHPEGAKKAPPQPTRKENPIEENMLKALTMLLVKKGIITREEIEAQLRRIDGRR